MTKTLLHLADPCACQESATNQINLQEDNADIVELLLAVVYGAHYGKWVASRCGRATEASKLVEPLETSLSVDGAARSFTASSEDLCTPTQECLDLKRLAKGPAPALAIYRERNAFDATLAEYFCVELKMHLDACTIADKYGVAELKRVAEASFADLLGDCWLSPKVLEVIKQLMSGPLGLESSLADVTISGLAARLSMFTPTEKLVDSLSASHPDFARLVLKQVILGSHAYETDVSTLRYCSWHMCRRNVKAKFVQGGRYVGNKYECTLCGNNLFVQSEAWKVNI